MKADHKVFSDNCESRNDHRYAVVVQNLTTEWIQTCPCKTKTATETQKKLEKVLGAKKETDNSLEFGKVCEDLSWNHCTSTSHKSKTNGIAERALRKKKKKTFWKRSSTENIHLGTAATNSKRKSCWFSWGIKKDSSTTSRLVLDAGEVIVDIFVHVRKLLISSSRWAKSQTLLVEKRVIPYFIRLHWRIQSNSYAFGCQVKAPHRLLMKYPWTSFTQFTLIGRKNSRRMYVAKEGLNEKTVDIQTRSSMPELWKSMEKMSSWKRSKSDHMKNFNSIIHEHYDGSFSLTRRIRI